MEDKKVILILVAVIVVLASMVSFVFLTSYKEVDSNYVYAPTPNEKVKFTGTYLGPYGGIYNLNGASGVIQVGNSYAIVSTDKLKGLENHVVTVKGYFINDKVEKETVPIDNRYVSGESFVVTEVL